MATISRLYLVPRFYDSRLRDLSAPHKSVALCGMLQVYCKKRNRNLGSSTHKRYQNRKNSEHLLLNSSGHFQSDDQKNVNSSSEDVMNRMQINFSDSNSIENLSAKAESIASSIGEKTIFTANADNEQGFPTDQLEVPPGMTKHAEKNVLLPSQSQNNEPKDLEHIFPERETLRAEINILEQKLAENDARYKVVSQEKIYVEFLENELERLKNEMHLSDAFDPNMLASNTSSQNVFDPAALIEELNALRAENGLLNDKIKDLNEKINNIFQKEDCVSMLEKDKFMLEKSVQELKSNLEAVQIDISELSSLKSECKSLCDKVETLQALLDTTAEQANQVSSLFDQNLELQEKVDKLEASLEESMETKSLEKSYQYDDVLLQKLKMLEERLQVADQEIHSHTLLYQKTLEEFQTSIKKLKERDQNEIKGHAHDMDWGLWSRILLLVDGWLFENKISSTDGRLLREMAWKKDHLICEAYLACNGRLEHETIAEFLKLSQVQRSQGLHAVHIAAEMAPIAKIGGLGDVVLGLSKALQRKGHLVEIVLPKYDSIHDQIYELKAMDVLLESFFDGQLFKNRIWTGIVEGLPVYFIEPYHPSNFFARGKIYGENDDFKRFSFFSRAALEFLYQTGKKPDIIHCHDWQTAFVAPLYWDIYAAKGFNSARICFTCHNFEHQGTAHASQLSSCGLDIQRLNSPDRMQDNSAHERVNPLKGAIVFSNIVTTVSPTYALEVCTPEGGKGLHDTLHLHSKKFVGILNGIDSESWNPSTDTYLSAQYSADDLQGKAENKGALRSRLELSSDDSFPLIGCITRLVPQKGVHLIRHAIYHTVELGGQFVLLGSSPIAHIQREFEIMANHFKDHPNVRLLLKYDDALSHLIYAASDMFIMPSLFEPCGLSQMIAMRYGSVPIVRRTGGLNDSVFDIDNDSIPAQYRNGFTFLTPNEQELSNAMGRAFNYYMGNSENWQKLVQKIMRLDFSWEASGKQYEELYEKAVVKARAAINA